MEWETIQNGDNALEVRNKLNEVGKEVNNNKVVMLNEKRALDELFARTEIANGCEPYSNIFYDMFYTAQYSFTREMLGEIDTRNMSYTGSISAEATTIDPDNMNYTNWYNNSIIWSNNNYIGVNIADANHNERIYIKPTQAFDSRNYEGDFPYSLTLSAGSYNISLGGGKGMGVNFPPYAVGAGGKGGTIVIEVTIATESTLTIKKFTNYGEYGASFHVFINDILYAAVGGGGSSGYELIPYSGGLRYMNCLTGGAGGGTAGNDGTDGKNTVGTGGKGANGTSGGNGGDATYVYDESHDGSDYPISLGGLFNSNGYCNGGCGYAGGGSGVGSTNKSGTTYSFTGGGGGSSYVITDASVTIYENSQGTNDTVAYIAISSLGEITLKNPLVYAYSNPILYRSYITKDTGTHKATLTKLHMRINIRSTQQLIKIISLFLQTSAETTLKTVNISYSSEASFDESNCIVVTPEIFLGYQGNENRFVSEIETSVPYATIYLEFESSNLEATSYLYKMLGDIE